MLNLEDLTLFVAFYRSGTLTKVAEDYLISQPTITRTMKRVEEAFGVSLFVRSVNRIELNETGKKAAEAAIRLLESAEQCESEVRSYDRQLHTIMVESCAPAPLWSFMPILNRKHPGRTITSDLLVDMDQIEHDLLTHTCHVAILTHPVEQKGIHSFRYLEEHLSICVPPSHDLAKYKEVTTAEINGYNCLLSSEIGFWTDFHRRMLPSSRFYVQTDEEAFRELIQASSLPCFTTDLASEFNFIDLGGRIPIPITDPEANVTYYLCWHERDFGEKLV